MSKANQLFLLADHIKLSLLERQRAQSLELDSDGQDGHLARSLDQFRSGLANLEQELEGTDDEASKSAVDSLRKQLDDLTAQHQGLVDAASQATLEHANSPLLAQDFAHASTRRANKMVRFSDSPSPNPRPGLVPYRDNPGPAQSNETPDLSSQQLHDYHSQVLDEQDEQLDRLGESIGRQRELSLQIGHELDNHVAMLDEVDNAANRHQDRLDGARKTLAKVAKGAGENKQMTAIVVLIIILVVLIALLK
ncbi:hypothetical protein CDD82_385 [Ophiocordyceps australis]|uniref:t-SNARE coiled-coil homology domain-containing protein n=1 Tax=Ophiocordyceps australis TaxID=1399860 RepID=A0A2C5ZQ83_9HYPO|nr:hypothetical protein CDD82_385 [Ophiocordyceps australis]